MCKVEPVIRRIITGRAPHLEPHLTILYIHICIMHINTYTHTYIYVYINKQTTNPSYRNLHFFNHISFRSLEGQCAQPGALPRHVRYTHWHLHPAAATLPQWAVSPSWMLGTGEGNGICHGFLEMGERRKSWVERGKKRADWGEVHTENVKQKIKATSCDSLLVGSSTHFYGWTSTRFQTISLKLGMDKKHTSFIHC
jgi:hypothetical protein